MTLLKLMTDPATAASVRVRAAERVVNHATNSTEIENIEARVTELEQAAEASRSHRRYRQACETRSAESRNWNEHFVLVPREFHRT